MLTLRLPFFITNSEKKLSFIYKNTFLRLGPKKYLHEETTSYAFDQIEIKDANL